MNKPKWMDDPIVAHISKEKLEFLSEMFEKVKDKSKNELIPYLMAMSGKTGNALRFSTAEMQSIITAIKRASTSDEQKQIEKLLDMAAKKRK